MGGNNDPGQDGGQTSEWIPVMAMTVREAVWSLGVASGRGRSEPCAQVQHGVLPPRARTVALPIRDGHAA